MGFSPGSVRRLSARTPLRTKLVATVVLIAVASLVTLAGASQILMRRHLVDRVDEQLVSVAQQTVNRVQGGWQGGGPGAELAAAADGSHTITARLPSDILAQVRRPDGTLLASTPLEDITVPGPRIDARTMASPRRTPFTVPDQAGAGHWRMVLVALGSGETDLLVATSLAEVGATLDDLLLIELALGVVVLVAVVAAGALIVRASLLPLAQMERTARTIAAGNLSQRVPDHDPRTEVGSLTTALNTMLGQIESAFRARARSEGLLRQFVADAGHELRTPLTAIRGFAQLYRNDPGHGAWLVDRIERAAGRMSLLVEDLLLLARLDQRRPLDRRPLDLLRLVLDATHETRAAAPDRKVDLDVRADTAYQVLGDEVRLRQVLDNLLSNALRHTPGDAPVEVRLRSAVLREAPAAVIEVADHGPGLTAEQAERVFERFYQVDPARSRGSGLGLAIVSALVDAHNGSVELDTAPGRGATFRVLLPLEPET
ncbi:HAMP domain-containing histidine kinase [Microbispora sp. RL4-1S]|uniref:histidine kinase n=1 Tax=Microbispora oryzae TaxID=2806554 RepID=A0A940WMM7_9ACTN|nr:HAMP domain-containing sensor histidine kinase [Microbispora oryzae]MBP2708271.1 HAMP domain-containing histidine kinase [Microbispora oryzae]